jgi:multidrug efflux pump subunit AcrB
MNKRGLLTRPVSAACALLALLAASLFSVIERRASGGAAECGAYTIVLRHYGVDMNEMERSVTIPLEDELSAIDGVSRLASSTENGVSRVFLFFGGRKPFFTRGKNRPSGRYESIRDAAQRVFETLPSSAQKPEIIAQDSRAAPVWSAAASAKERGAVLAEILEKTIKPALAGIEGVASVEISGAGINEITVTMRRGAPQAAGLDPSALAAALAQNDAVFPAGFAMEGERRVPLSVSSRFPSIDELSRALIALPGGGWAPLGAIAALRERERPADTITRLNGKKAALISILSVQGADLGALSRRISRALSSFSRYPVELTVLSDGGADEARSFRSALIAAAQAAFTVAFLAAFLIRRRGAFRWREAAACACFVPVSGLIAAALLSLAGVPFDKTLLAGLAAGIGSALDAALLSAEKIAGLPPAKARLELRRLRPALVSGSLTTIIALLPLFLLPFSPPSVAALALSIAAVTLTALLLSLTLLPPFLVSAQRGGGLPPRSSRLRRLALPPSLGGVFYRLAAAFRAKCGGVLFSRPLKPPAVILAAALLCGGGVISFCARDVAAEDGGEDGALFVRLEFQGGLAAVEADRRLEAWARRLSRCPGIVNVETAAQNGGGTALVNYDPARLDAPAARALVCGEPVQGGFSYLQGGGGGAAWELSVFGDSAEICRDIARSLAEACYSIGRVSEVVLNFKEGGARLLLHPDREKIAVSRQNGGLPFSGIAQNARGGVFGPVIYKRLDTARGGEIDVRLRSVPAELVTREALLDMPLPSRGGAAYRLGSVVRVSEEKEWTRLYRENRRRAASITLISAPCDPRALRAAVLKAARDIKLPPGYALEFDRAAIQAAEDLSSSVFYFMLALLLCYLVIAAATESALLPLAALAVIPVSLSLPAIALACAGVAFDAAALCAFIAVSGVAVNAAVLISSEIQNGARGTDFEKLSPAARGDFVRALVRSRRGALFATGTTTIVCALPFLFLAEHSNGMIRVLSLVTVLGVAASLVCAVTLIPALAILAPRLFVQKEIL